MPATPACEGHGGKVCGIHPASGEAKMMVHAEDLPSLTADGFATLGIDEVAYLRRGLCNGAPIYTLHAADGGFICRVPDVPSGVEMLRKNGMRAVSLH
jgi:hypothetical protein